MRDFCDLSFCAFREKFESMYVSVRCALRMTIYGNGSCDARVDCSLIQPRWRAYKS